MRRTAASATRPPVAAARSALKRVLAATARKLLIAAAAKKQRVPKSSQPLHEASIKKAPGQHWPGAFRFTPDSAVECCRNESLRAISSQFLAKRSVKQILSERSEFICCSDVSLELQKWHVRSNAGSVQLPNRGSLLPGQFLPQGIGDINADGEERPAVCRCQRIIPFALDFFTGR